MDLLTDNYPNWKKINEFFTIQLECSETNQDMLSSKEYYESSFQYLLRIIEKGIEDGEFCPDQSIHLLINSIIITLIGVITIQKNIQSERFYVNKQLHTILGKLREDLIVI